MDNIYLLAFVYLIDLNQLVRNYSYWLRTEDDLINFFIIVTTPILRQVTSISTIAQQLQFYSK